MAQPTPRQTEINMIVHRLRAGAHVPGDRTRLEKLFTEEVLERIQPELARLEAELPAMRRAVQRRQAAARKMAVQQWMEEQQRLSAQTPWKAWMRK